MEKPTILQYKSIGLVEPPSIKKQHKESKIIKRDEKTKRLELHAGIVIGNAYSMTLPKFEDIIDDFVENGKVDLEVLEVISSKNSFDIFELSDGSVGDYEWLYFDKARGQKLRFIVGNFKEGGGDVMNIEWCRKD